MARPSRRHEQTFNVVLGRALREATLRWQGAADVIRCESPGILAEPHQRQRPDLLAMHPDFLPVIVETSFDAADADRDASQRLVDGVRTADGRYDVLTAVAVHVPESYRTIPSDDGVFRGADVRHAV